MKITYFEHSHTLVIIAISNGRFHKGVPFRFSRFRNLQNIYLFIIFIFSAVLKIYTVLNIYAPVLIEIIRLKLSSSCDSWDKQLLRIELQIPSLQLHLLRIDLQLLSIVYLLAGCYYGANPRGPKEELPLEAVCGGEPYSVQETQVW